MRSHFLRVFCLGSTVLLGTAFNTDAEDWTRFRGENGSGVALEAKDLPETFSEKENVKWKVTLPGPGHSSPIIVGNKVLLTCWSGYGTDANESGTMDSLKRHLVCLERSTGNLLWEKSVKAILPEDDYQGMFAEHGYATHTPVTDGTNVYAFFGKSGVHAYDLDGKELWQAEVGSGLDPQRWGSSCSPILVDNLLVVLASAESQTMFAFDKSNGDLKWKKKADGFGSTWGTPAVAQSKDGTKEIVVGVPYEVWGFAPDSGKFKWFVSIADTNSFCSSVVVDKDKIFALEGRNGGAYAIRSGGKDDATKTNLIWEKNYRNRISTPVVLDDRIYFIADGIVRCINESTGEMVYEGRLPAGNADNSGGAGRPNRGGPGGGGAGGPGGRGGRGGMGGMMGGQDYSSPVAGDGKLYYIRRGGNIHVLKLGDKFKSLAVNQLTQEAEDVSSTPAIADDQIFIRSSKHLWCVSKH